MANTNTAIKRLLLVSVKLPQIDRYRRFEFRSFTWLTAERQIPRRHGTVPLLMQPAHVSTTSISIYYSRKKATTSFWNINSQPTPIRNKKRRFLFEINKSIRVPNLLMKSKIIINDQK